MPIGIKPEYDWGFIPSKIYFDEKTGIFSATFDTSETSKTYLYTYFNLPGLEFDFDPFETLPVPDVTPSYCALEDSEDVALKLSPAKLKTNYDYAHVWLEVYDVKSISITETTPEADYTYVYNDTDSYDVTVKDGVDTTQDLTLYPVPTVKMSITPVDDIMTEKEIKICYDITIENTHTKIESISLYADDDIYNGSYWTYDALDWTFSESYFSLNPGEKKVIKAEAEYVGREDLQEEKYAVEFWCHPTSEGITGFYYLYDFFEFREIPKLSVSVSTDKTDYHPGDVMEVTITMTNTFNTSKTVTLYWWLTIPQFDYMKVMLAQPYILPPELQPIVCNSSICRQMGFITFWRCLECSPF